MELKDKAYKETWKKELPDKMRYNCLKGISREGDLFLQNDLDGKTVCYDGSLTKRAVLHPGGICLDSIDEDVFYGQGTWHGSDFKIVVHKTVEGGKSTSGVLASASQRQQLSPNRKMQLEEHQTLEPPSPYRWKSALSVCRTELGDVVVDFDTRSMEMYDQDGRKYFALKIHFITEISIRK